MRVASIVEGHGEVAAVPVLLRRILSAKGRHTVEILRPMRVARNRLLVPAELERAVQHSMVVAGPGGIVFVLLDGDDDCPAVLGPSLLARVRGVCAENTCMVVVAQREFEAWFLAAAESLAGRRGLPATLQSATAAESIRDAKGWLGHHLGRRYSETRDQPAFAASIDLDLARRNSASFDKLMRDVERFLATP